MSVKVRQYKRGGWEVDILFRLPNGKRHRERCKSPVNSKSAAQRWGEDRERHLLIHGPDQPKKEVPTLEHFAPRFIDERARANQLKPSGIEHKEMILRRHLVPALGSKRLDAITTEDVQRLKHRLREQKPKSVNNVLTVLSTMLKKAVEWNVIERLPCAIRILKTTSASVDFYSFNEYDRLVQAAKQLDTLSLVIVLLGGDAGLRAGKMRALRWSDVDFDREMIRVERNDWRGEVSSTKGGRLRYVPMTALLREALRSHRHLRSPLVLTRAGGERLTEGALVGALSRTAKRADLRCTGPHMLRHTFCSHLAMRGAPARSIQELAGHRDLATTQRYMHLSPAAVVDAIRLLVRPTLTVDRGDGVETGVADSEKASG